MSRLLLALRRSHVSFVIDSLCVRFSAITWESIEYFGTDQWPLIAAGGNDSLAESNLLIRSFLHQNGSIKVHNKIQRHM